MVGRCALLLLCIFSWLSVRTPLLDCLNIFPSENPPTSAKEDILLFYLLVQTYYCKVCVLVCKRSLELTIQYLNLYKILVTAPSVVLSN